MVTRLASFLFCRSHFYYGPKIHTDVPVSNLPADYNPKFVSEVMLLLG
jgi:hypothetical protein